MKSLSELEGEECCYWCAYCVRDGYEDEETGVYDEFQYCSLDHHEEFDWLTGCCKDFKRL